MLIVHVFVQVKAGHEADFELATLANVRESLKEAGIARFDVVRQADDPTKFVLVEAYRSDDAPAAHKETSHYKAWRDAVEPWMAAPRSSVKYREIHPSASAW